MKKAVITYAEGNYLFTTRPVVSYPADSNCSKAVTPSVLSTAFLTSQEVRALAKKDRYGTPLFSKLGFVSMFHVDCDPGMMEGSNLLTTKKV